MLLIPHSHNLYTKAMGRSPNDKFLQVLPIWLDPCLLPRKLPEVIFLTMVVLLLVCAARASESDASTSAQEQPGFLAGPELTDGWFGLRPELQQHGVTLGSSLTQFFQGLVGGDGNHELEYGGKLDLSFTLNGQKLGLWPGLFVSGYGGFRYGETTNSAGGTLLPSNTALFFPKAKGDVFSLTSLTVTQFLSPNLAISAGRFDTVQLYNTPFAGGYGLDKFMNLAFTAPPIVGTTVPPVTLGAMLLVLHEQVPVFTAAVFNSKNTPVTTGFEKLGSNGWTILLEATLPVKLCGLSGKYSVDGTYSTERLTSLSQDPLLLLANLLAVKAPLRIESGPWTVDFAFNQYLYQKPDNPKNGWGLFGYCSFSDADPNPISFFAHAGIGGTSPIPGRQKDDFGIGYYYLALSDHLKETLQPFTLLPVIGPTLRLRDEQGVEIFYNVALTGWMKVAADLQIIQPGLASAPTATISGVRAKIDF
jgi:porin